MTGPQSFSINEEILSLCWTAIIILVLNRNEYKSEVKSCAEEESEEEIQFAINTISDKIIAVKAQNIRKK